MFTLDEAAAEINAGALAAVIAAAGPWDAARVRGQVRDPLQPGGTFVHGSLLAAATDPVGAVTHVSDSAVANLILLLNAPYLGRCNELNPPGYGCPCPACP
jgi:hypothetical protein